MIRPRYLIGWLLDPEIRRLREDAARNAAELARWQSRSHTAERAATIAITERAKTSNEVADLRVELDQAKRDLASEEALHARVRHQRDMALAERYRYKRHAQAADARLVELGESSVDNDDEHLIDRIAKDG
jgi:hypothetical protein